MNRIIKFVIRQLIADKRNSIIQLLGLSLGIVSCIVIMQYVLFEYSYDKFHVNAELKYRVNGTCPMPVGPLAKEELSYVSDYARLHPVYRDAVININENSYLERGLYFADNSIFSIFSFPVIQGDAKQALSVKNNLVISEKYAEKYFGKTNPIGQQLKVNSTYESNQVYTVGAVFKDIPSNSHLKFDILLSIENIICTSKYSKENPWKWGNFFTYLETNRKLTEEVIAADLNRIAIENGALEVRSDPNFPVSSIKDLHLDGAEGYMGSNMSAGNIYLWAIIAIVIMFIAWLNYINMCIANSFKTKVLTEVKRAIGAGNRILWVEHFFKSLLINISALLLSVLLVRILSPIFKEAGGITIGIPDNYQILFWGGIIFMVLTGAMFSSFVSYYSSSKHTLLPIFANKSGAKTNSRKSPWVFLLVTQFAASIILICFALFTSKQINGLINSESGINTRQVLAIHSARVSGNSSLGESRKIFEEEVLKIPGVEISSSATYLPGMHIPSYMKTSLPNATEKEEIQTRMNFVGYNYLQLFEHKFLAGRNFSEKLKTDQSGVVINKRMTAMYGFSNPQDAIGKEIQWKIMNRTKVIIGVVDDFLQQSAENEIEPLMFHLWDNASGYSIVNIETKDAQSCFLSIQKLWNRIHPENPFEYVWVDDVYAQQFSRWRQYSRMATLLSTIAILIACIGLFGLTSLILSQRTKEIGIRKVNGAKISEIMQLINSGFIKWVIIAFIIAVPVAYLTIGKWLENFAYQTTLSWWIFVLAGVMALGIALLTVSWQSWKAATRNPVEALRYE